MDDTSKTLRRWVTFAGCVLVVVVLYWAQAVLVPIALAILLTFVLTPPVTWLQRWIGRIPAVLAMVTLVFTVLGLAGWGLARQMDHLAEDLPRYRANILTKIADVRSAGKGGSVEKLQDTIEDIKTDLGKSEVPRGTISRPVVVTSEQVAGFSGFTWLSPIVGPLGTAGLVLAMVIFMLLERRDLRDRVIGVLGDGQRAVTTTAFDEAGTRVSRQLLMQSLVNLLYGVAAGAGLYVLDVPYPLVWAALAAVLRFIPYVGPVLGAGAPILVSLAAAEGWAGPLYVVGLFVVLELFTNLVLETVSYAGAAGVSPVALLARIRGVLDVALGAARPGLGHATDRVPCGAREARARSRVPRHALGRHASARAGVWLLPAPARPRSERGGRPHRAVHQNRVPALGVRRPAAACAELCGARPLGAALVARRGNGRHRRDAGAAVGRRGVNPGPQPWAVRTA
jgi:predicted PurR-regulated permease PerM